MAKRRIILKGQLPVAPPPEPPPPPPLPENSPFKRAARERLRDRGPYQAARDAFYSGAEARPQEVAEFVTDDDAARMIARFMADSSDCSECGGTGYSMQDWRGENGVGTRRFPGVCRSGCRMSSLAMAMRMLSSGVRRRDQRG